MDKLVTSDVFGGCPRCNKSEGYLNIGRQHWFWCSDHRTKWCAGSNLFSSWKQETEEEQQKAYRDLGFGNYEEVKPLFRFNARPEDDKMPPEVIARMPWTNEMMSDDDFKQWVASRKEAGLHIDIETCELGYWKAFDCDVYGLSLRLGELPVEMQQVGTNRYVRSAESNGWINEEDLPLEKALAMYDRIERNALQPAHQ